MFIGGNLPFPGKWVSSPCFFIGGNLPFPGKWAVEMALF